VLAGELERSHPGAAASLREGLEETLTLQRLGIDGQLWRTLSSTNPIESMIAIGRRTSRNVKHWSSGDMCLRWTAAGMLEAERQFRKIIGYQHLARLAVAVKRDVAAQRVATPVPTMPTEPVPTLATVNSSPDPHSKVPQRSGHLAPREEDKRGEDECPLLSLVADVLTWRASFEPLLRSPPPARAVARGGRREREVVP